MCLLAQIKGPPSQVFLSFSIQKQVSTELSSGWCFSLQQGILKPEMLSFSIHPSGPFPPQTSSGILESMLTLSKCNSRRTPTAQLHTTAKNHCLWFKPATCCFHLIFPFFSTGKCSFIPLAFVHPLFYISQYLKEHESGDKPLRI